MLLDLRNKIVPIIMEQKLTEKVYIEFMSLMLGELFDRDELTLIDSAKLYEQMMRIVTGSITRIAASKGGEIMEAHPEQIVEAIRWRAQTLIDRSSVLN